MASRGLPMLAGRSSLLLPGRSPRITTLNGQTGTAIVWLSDVNQVSWHSTRFLTPTASFNLTLPGYWPHQQVPPTDLRQWADLHDADQSDPGPGRPGPASYPELLIRSCIQFDRSEQLQHPPAPAVS